MKVRELAETIGISIDRVHFILHHELHMEILCAQCLPCLSTLQQKRNCMRTSVECLQLFKKNSADLLRRFVTMDETWIHHYTSATKQQSKLISSGILKSTFKFYLINIYISCKGETKSYLRHATSEIFFYLKK